MKKKSDYDKLLKYLLINGSILDADNFKDPLILATAIKNLFIKYKELIGVK